jgi:hypothetical protein
MTDPVFQGTKAALDYELATEKGLHDTALGVDGAGGRIKQDWQYAIDALTRGTRDNTSKTNAGLSGSNLAGSGIARRSLSDIAASFLADKSDYDTKLQRGESDALNRWTDYNTKYGAQVGAAQGVAAESWRRLNEGVTPDAPVSDPKPTPPAKPSTGTPKPTKPARRPGHNPQGIPTAVVGNPRDPDHNPTGIPTAVVGAPKKVSAPPGKKYVKDPARPGKYKLVNA